LAVEARELEVAEPGTGVEDWIPEGDAPEL
jgi:hypothetical protein